MLNNRLFINGFSLFFVGLLVTSCFSDSEVSKEEVADFEEVINIYSDRHYPIDDTIYKRFEETHNIKVNLVKGKSEDLLARIEKEGDATKADLLITADVGRLYQAKSADLFQAVKHPEGIDKVNNYLYDQEGYWFGITKRARVIVYDPEKVNEEELTSYEDLANPEWKGRIAVRSKGNIYNQSLLASIISANGEDAALEWVKGVVNNMARPPKGNDRDQIKFVYAGKADLAIVNTYYLGKMLFSDDPVERVAGGEMEIFFPNQEGRGAHINVSGVGVLKASENVEAARKLIAYLLTPEIQELYAQANFEFPVVDGVELHETVESWGEFKEDTVQLNKIGENNTLAIKLFDKGGWK